MSALSRLIRRSEPAPPATADSGKGADAVDADFTLALEEARRGFDGVNAELPALRNRATQIIGVGGLAASFIGGLALRPATAGTAGQIGGWGWVAIGAFAATVLLSLAILWPWRSYGSVEPWRLVEWAEKGESEQDMTRDLALHMGEKYDKNRVLLDRLSRFHSAAAVTLVIEVAAFMIDLGSS